VLEPQDRRLLLESLRPPLGYQLDQAIGTTFTLDLVALLTAPLAFTLFDLEQRDNGRPSADPLALLKATRDHADAITIFCHAGRIAVPPENQLLYSQLEGVVIETTAPAGGVFHPKLWLLRYVANGGPVRYRLLCLSRNLTFDRSWDACLRLDGELRRRKNAYAANHPIGDFIAALPRLALRRSIPKPRRTAIDLMADEVRRVEFEPPDGFSGLGFHPLGIPRYRRSPFGGDMRRTLVVSPFVDEAGLRAATGGTSEGGHVLVSRTESLARLGDADALDAFDSVKVLNDAAESELEAAAQAEEEEASLDQTLDGALRGLHAKLYVADAGWDARVWVGSANATEAALRRNVEFLVELIGTGSRCGVDAVLVGPAAGVPGFGDLLVDYEAADEIEIDELAEALEREAGRLQTALAEERLVANVQGPDGDGRYSLLLARPGRKGLSLPQGATLRAWLITQTPSHARVVEGRKADELVRLDGLEVEHLTTFVAFELELRREGRKHVSRFVLNVPLRGAPRGRHEAVLRTLLRDKERLLRYLLFVLAEAEGVQSLSPPDLAAIAGGGNGDDRGWGQLQFPLFEALVRTLARDPQKLSQIARLLEDLGDGDQLEELLPDGFRDVWDPIWAARGGR
jgi:hypothetical protein